MSGQHWIDRFFRKRLEHRMFPVEEGEFEDVRALLHQRNGTSEVFKGAGSSKWWFSALIPMAGLLWWAVAENMDRSGDRVAPTTAERRMEAPDADQHTDNETGDANVQRRSELSLAAVGTEPDAPELHAIDQGAKAATVNDVVVHTCASNGSPSALATGAPQRVSNATMGQLAADSHADVAMGTSRSGQGEMRSPAGSGTQAAEPDGTLRSELDNERSVQVDANIHLDDEGAQRNVVAPTLSGQDPMEVLRDEREEATSFEGIELLPMRNEMDAVMFMEPRRSTPTVVGTPEPIRINVEHFKDHPMGELHFFGAPLSVRTRSSSGERSDVEMGSLVGLDYRVRAKRFSWATGIHYGSYALKGDQGATDVKLNFVEVPLLASYQLIRRRIGLSLQGGLSMDLLFNSRGSYRVEGDRSGGAFPDDAFGTVNCSWLLRPQVTYHVADHLSVNAGPLWKAQFGEVAKEGSLDGAKVSSSGIAIGITWRLERSTF